MTYKRILVPLDGSKLAEVVFSYAKELAGTLDLDVILLHVYPAEEDEFTPVHRAYITHAVDLIRQQSGEVQKRVDMEAGTKLAQVQGELLTGAADEGILRYADEKNVDFILMASHSRSGLRHWAMGKVADKVLRISKVPVLLVRAGVPNETPYDKWPSKAILVPMDGSEMAEAVLPHVEALARQRGARPVEVVLLRVCEPPAMPTYYAPEFSGVPLNWGEYMQQEIARCKQTAGQYLNGIEKRLKDDNINARSEVLVGKAPDEIINYIKKNPFNLIVMATHGRSGLSRWVYGSVAESVLLGVSSPIFLVKPRQTDSITKEGE